MAKLYLPNKTLACNFGCKFSKVNNRTTEILYLILAFSKHTRELSILYFVSKSKSFKTLECIQSQKLNCPIIIQGSAHVVFNKFTQICVW